MSHHSSPTCEHPLVSRRAAVQAGAIGLLGFGMNHVAALRTDSDAATEPRAKACIYIFLSGGLSQIDSFDLKPAAPAGIRGDFQPIATRSPGIEICEHLPMLAERSRLWSLCRSLTHPYNEHFEGHMVMLSGQTALPPGFDLTKPRPTDWPSMAAIANAVVPPRNNLPPAMILPERLIQPRLRRIIPGQGAGMMGPTREPWFVEASPYRSEVHGAYPGYQFEHTDKPFPREETPFQAPNLSLPVGLGSERFRRRVDLLDNVESQQRALRESAEGAQFNRFREKAIDLLADRTTQRAFDVHGADPQVQDRYGRNSFGWSLLMARQLIEAGVSLVQVNLGNNSTWDTHGNAFPHLKEKLFPPTDRALSALLDDLAERGLLASTLIVVASEFGRTPHISGGPSYKTPGRNHWGGVQSVLLAGGGVQGGRVVGSSNKHGAYPDLLAQKPENLAATIYQSLGVPSTAAWQDALKRPHFVYHGEPIPGLT